MRLSSAVASAENFVSIFKNKYEIDMSEHSLEKYLQT